MADYWTKDHRNSEQDDDRIHILDCRMAEFQVVKWQSIGQKNIRDLSRKLTEYIRLQDGRILGSKMVEYWTKDLQSSEQEVDRIYQTGRRQNFRQEDNRILDKKMAEHQTGTNSGGLLRLFKQFNIVKGTYSEVKPGA